MRSVDMEIPKSAIDRLIEEYERIDHSFSRIWRVLPVSEERDEIMWHLASAKVYIRRFIKKHSEVVENGNG
jgi:hypothetical protein